MQKGVATSISEHNVNSDADCTMFCLSGPFSFILWTLACKNTKSNSFKIYKSIYWPFQ